MPARLQRKSHPAKNATVGESFSSQGTIAGKSGSATPSAIHSVLASPGQPLDASTRGLMETRFGHDFSGVRIHTDATADGSARAVSADAYTVNNHVVFRSGNYAPQTLAGRKLIAHELTHTLQQRDGPSDPHHGLTLDSSTSAAEAEAVQSEQFAVEPTSGSFANNSPVVRTAPLIQRQPTPGEDPARYQKTHAALFTPPAKAGAASGPGAAIPVFDQAAQDSTKQQFETYLTDLKRTKPGVFRPELPDNTNKTNADETTVAMDKQLRTHFPQISQPIPEATLLSHISILQDADVAKDDFLRQWLSNRLAVTDVAAYQLPEKDPVYQKFLGDILADKKIGPLVRELARHGGAYIEESGGTHEVHLNQGLDSQQRETSLLHELVHFYANPAYKAWVNTTSNPRFFDEGFTEFLTRRAMTAEQLKVNGSSYQDRFDAISKEIASRIPDDDIARAYFAGEVWRIEGKSAEARKTFATQTNLDPSAARPEEKKQSQTAAAINETVTPGEHYRFMNFGDEAATPKAGHVAFFTQVFKDFIANDPTARVRFVGHTSSTGTPAFNDALSRERAAAFYQMARDTGVPEAQLIDAKAAPHSAAKEPTAGNDEVIGRSFNRRVELFITHVSSANGASPAGGTDNSAMEDSPIQRKSAIAHAFPPSTVNLIETARAGLRDASVPLPYANEIQRSFGQHSIANIRTQVGGAAGAAARSIGSVAYAMGNAVGFAQPPDLATAAHEAAHVVQQRKGVTLPGGVGSSGDPYENHADMVASLVTRGLSAEAALDAPPGGGGERQGVQRLAFVNEKQVKKSEKDFTAAMKSMVTDTPVRNYLSLDEFKKHSEKTTDYLGNLADGTWLRFNPTGTNLLGENHTEVTLEDSVPAVGSKSFIYEPFSSDKMTAGSNFEAAYAKEATDRFKRFGVEKEKDKQQFGAESLLPKMGFNLALLQPYFDGKADLEDLKSSAYVGQPTQRYLKIAWGWSKDNQLDAEKKAKAGDFVPPKFKKLADLHLAVTAKLDPFITALKVDGHLGDELAKKANLPLLPLLADFARTFTEAMMRVAAESPNSRLSMGQRAALTGSSVTSEKDKMKMFAEWRDFMFEDNVAAATKRGVRYAGMGQAHLDHLVKTGLDKAQHPFRMAGKDIADFRALTGKLKKAAGAKP